MKRLAWIAACLLLVPATVVIIYFAAVGFIYGNTNTPILGWMLLVVAAILYALNVYFVVTLRPTSESARCRG